MFFSFSLFFFKFYICPWCVMLECFFCFVFYYVCLFIMCVSIVLFHFYSYILHIIIFIPIVLHCIELYYYVILICLSHIFPYHLFSIACHITLHSFTHFSIIIFIPYCIVLYCVVLSYACLCFFDVMPIVLFCLHGLTASLPPSFPHLKEQDEDMITSDLDRPSELSDIAEESETDLTDEVK